MGNFLSHIKDQISLPIEHPKYNLKMELDGSLAMLLFGGRQLYSTLNSLCLL